MKVLLTGGGSGGHITPVIAVAQKLKAHDPTIEVIYVAERKSRFHAMVEHQPVFDERYGVFAGKFRRYHGQSWLARLLDVKTNLLNLRDAFYVCLGVVQSWFLLRKLQPDVILLKGGYAGVPIGLAARKRYPIITHDSDALPGLSNRLVSRWAVYHATGMPAENYQYPKDKIKYVGVIVGEQYVPVTAQLQKEYRQALQLPEDAEVLMITGGSNGATNVNAAVADFVPDLLAARPKLQVIHQAGKGNEGLYGNYHNTRLHVFGLLEGMYRYSGAADLLITRAGANTIAEFGVQGKACVVIPNPELTGGHQLKNAQALADAEAAVIVDEADLKTDLKPTVEALLDDTKRRTSLGHHLQQITKTDAADRIADLLIDAARRRAGE